MKRHISAIVLGVIIVGILGLYMVAFTVRWQEKALVLTFGKIEREVQAPGLNWQWPWQSVVRFDGRIRTLRQRATETMTRDKQNIIVTVYVNWRITDAKRFYESFRERQASESEAVVALAEEAIGAWVSAAKNVFTEYDLSELISLGAENFRLGQVEKSSAGSRGAGMLERVRENAAAGGGYGVEIVDLGIRQFGVPDPVTEKVFARMIAEREAEQRTLIAEGESRAASIVGEAKSKETIIKADAEAQAKLLEGQGDAEAAEYYARFLAHPELANFLRRLETLRTTLNDRTTIILDNQSPPYDLLTTGAKLDGMLGSSDESN